MVSIRRFWSIMTILALPVLILGCGEGDGGGVTVEPLADEPILLESVLCLDVDDARPVWITDSFLASDNDIYLWMYWTNIEDNSKVKVVWFSPKSELPFREDSQTMESSSGFQITWFYVSKPSDGFDEGEWTVEIYLDGLFERSYLFTVG